MRNLTILEADICSHAEAVLKGRLSLRHQMAMGAEQTRYERSLGALQQLHRIESRLSGNSSGLDGDKSGNGLWSELRRQIQFGVILRHFRKPTQNRNSDDLWRMWYSGVQSVTLSVSMMASPPNGMVGTENPSFTPSNSPLKRMISLKNRVRGSFNLGDRRGSKASNHSATAPCSPTPSHEEQDEVLGAYTSADLHTSSSLNKKEKKRLNKLIKDETELIEIVGMAEAPKQRCDENEL